MRTNLQYVLKDPNQKLILVTSAISGEGKTFCSVNLAAVMAISNKKTLIVGLDLRRPKVHKTFDLENEKGISTYLIGKHAIDEIIYPSKVPNLDVAVSGPVPPNPAELIETKRMHDFFRIARERYDYIVVDSPPLAIVSDGLYATQFADANLFVLRQRYSQKDEIKLINEIDEKGKMKNMNLIINDIEKPRGYAYGYSYRYGYSYGYNYGYGYGYGYYEEDRAKSPLALKFARWWHQLKKA
ncbi:MAG: CpsD/CapB family tyrosine-protein kinase [Bacteroidales bacterium]|nr:CpsD/CapB family tyrosine-protein kinase [Bacteroidales bacterium]